MTNGKVWEKPANYQEPPTNDGYWFGRFAFTIFDRPDADGWHRSALLALIRRARPPHFDVTMNSETFEYDARMSRGKLVEVLADLRSWGLVFRESPSGRTSTKYRVNAAALFRVVDQAETLPDLQRTPEVLAGTAHTNPSPHDGLSANPSPHDANPSPHDGYTSLIEIERRRDPTRHLMTGCDTEEPTNDAGRARQLIAEAVAGTEFGELYSQYQRRAETRRRSDQDRAQSERADISYRERKRETG